MQPNNSTTSSHAPRLFLQRALLLLSALTLLSAPPAAQTAQGTKLAEAERLLDEGVPLFKAGTKDSLEQSLQKLEQARSIFHSLNDITREAFTLLLIGKIYSDLSENQKALDVYHQLLPFLRSIDAKKDEAIVLNNIGSLYADVGEKQKALDYFEQSLPIFRAISNKGGEANTLNFIGGVYRDVGEQQKALDLYSRSLPLFRAVNDKGGEAVALRNIGTIYADLGDRRRALDFYSQALPVFQAARNRGGEAVLLNDIGNAYDDLGEEQKALDSYKQALSLFRVTGDRAREARTLNNIGLVYRDLGEQQKALDSHNQSLALSRAIDDKRGEATSLANIAAIERDGGNLLEARAKAKIAIDLIESLRTKIVNHDLRASFFATVQQYYDFDIDVLMRLHAKQPGGGHDGEALQVSEQARARVLLETLAEANADIREGVDPKLIERERKIRQRLNARAQEKLKLLQGPHTKEQADALSKEVETLTTDLQQAETKIRQTSPRYAALTQPVPLSLKEIQSAVLDADSLLLEYSLGAEKSYLWAVTPDSITSYELPKGEEIETEARRFYDVLNSRNREIKGETVAQKVARVAQNDAEVKTVGAKLSRMILGPVAAKLKGKRLVVVADGALQFIPFAALPEPSGDAAAAPLVAEHEVVNLPSASTLAVLRRETGGRAPAPLTLAVLADPVFSRRDPRLTSPNGEPKAGGLSLPLPEDEGGRGISLVAKTAAKHAGVTNADLIIPRLPGTRREADEIVKLIAPAQYKKALDFAASRATATGTDLSRYRYVHFATHGFLDSRQPELSGIALSMFDERGEPQDGFLRAHEVFNLKLSADVVVLSACRTGLGKEVKGEGLVGLTRGFMYAGAPRVVVSLWNVNDAATAELMVRFYRGMLKEKLRPAAALRAAQISLMKERGRESPFYWAAFTLQGEWR